MHSTIEPLPPITSVQSQTFSRSSNSQSSSKISPTPNESNIQLPEKNTNFFPKPQPIGIYNFRSNKNSYTSLEQTIDEIVSSFIEKNRENIFQYVSKEVQQKLEEKIIPMSEEISKLKNDFNSLYEEEWNDFKQANVLNDCHQNIMELNHKMNIMNENIKNYNNNIKGFNVADNRIQFLSKLNKDLDEFLSGIWAYLYTSEKKNVGLGSVDMDIEENIHKIEKEMNKQQNLNQELDNVFFETMEMLKDIIKDNNNNLGENDNNNIIINYGDILNNFKNTVNAFETKFNYEKPINYNQNEKINNINNNVGEKGEKNIFDGLPNFFD